jgi:sialate O-acetylesterase
LKPRKTAHQFPFPRKILLAVIGLLTAFQAAAKVRPAKLFSDNMVLQRDAPLKLWGWADPGERVTVRFRGQETSASAAQDGHWSLTLPPQKAGGPEDLVFRGKNTLIIRNVLVGDVWLASGQSNMAFPLKEADRAAREIDDAHYPDIRLFVVKRGPALKPMHDVPTDEAWTAATPASAANFSAVAYLFGRELHERYKVPIGIIESDYGGTPAEVWASAQALQPFAEFHPALEAISRADDPERAEYERYLQQQAAWMTEHQTEDRGRVGDRYPWAAPNLAVSGWPTITIPRPWFLMGEDFKGFGGTVWFRKELPLSTEQANHGLYLHLGKMIKTDVSFFNGEQIGSTSESDKARVYFVPARLVLPGKNVIAVRLTGNDPSFGAAVVGMFGHLSSAPAKMYADTGKETIPLAGSWSCQPGPDLSSLPDPPPYAALTRPLSHAPTVLYNAMIAPLIPFRIKGVIWYQGESNETNPVLYRKLFPALIADWRGQWDYDFPFLFVQLAGFNHNEPALGNFPWGELRDAQAAALSSPGTGMATAIDLGDEEDIHPKDKQDVAHRLVLTAAKVAYGENVIASGPTYQSMQVEGNRIRVKFSDLGSGLLIKDQYGYIHGFEVAAADGKFAPAQAEQEGSDIIVFNRAVSRPVAVRYDWSNTPDGDVYNREGLPALPFRAGARSKPPADTETK